MVYLDERAVANSVFHKTVTSTRTISTIWISDYETKNFVFAPLEMTGENVFSSLGVRSVCERII